MIARLNAGPTAGREFLLGNFATDGPPARVHATYFIHVIGKPELGGYRLRGIEQGIAIYDWEEKT
jgi:hypothetical protein